MKVLDSSNFDRIVLQSDQVWIVQLYAKWCGHCGKVADEFIKLGTCLQFRYMCATLIRKYSTNYLFKSDRVNSIHLGAIDVYGNEKKFIKSFHLKGVPTIMIYGLNKSAPIVYKGNRAAYDILQFVLTKTRKTSNKGVPITGYGSDEEPDPEEEIVDEDSVITNDDIVNESTQSSEESMMSTSGILYKKKMLHNIFVCVTVAFYSVLIIL